MIYEGYLKTTILKFNHRFCGRCNLDPSDFKIPYPYYFVEDGTYFVKKLCSTCLKTLVDSGKNVEKLSYEDLEIIDKSNSFILNMKKVKSLVHELGFNETQKLLNEIAIEDVIK